MKRVYQDRVERLWEYMRFYWDKYGRLPSYRSIMGKKIGYHSMATITADIARLKEAGLLFTDDENRTSIVKSKLLEPFNVGTVTCGSPAEAVEEAGDDLITILFEGAPENYTIITARGYSMTGKKIYDGDKLIVRKQPCAEPGDVVIARIAGETTCKTLAKDENGLYLKPENPTYNDIRPDYEWNIYGVVKHVIHSL